MARKLRGNRYLDQAIADPKGAGRNIEEVVKFLTEELDYLDFDETKARYDAITNDGAVTIIGDAAAAYLACNDRYFLLTGVLGRVDLLHPWLFDRCREVEREPEGHVDLWARGHGKSSIITTGGAIQEIVCDPETTIAIFAATKPLASEFLGQIKNEFETNECLKRLFADVLYESPRGRDPDGSRPAKWSLQRGITVKRKGHPKEATVEAHGLIDGQPTGRHFKRHIYDDIVTQDYLAEEQLRKTIERFELADNLGTRLGVVKWIAGTRYHFADAYGHMLEKGMAKPRIYPATEDGTLNGQPVLLQPENWERIKRDQGTKTVNAQMLLNPLAGSEATFQSVWLSTYDVLPAALNVYVMVDPSKGKGERSDRTAISVIGVDQGGSKYLIEGYCHRMKLSERWHLIKSIRRTLLRNSVVKDIKIGYEQYGLLDDISVLEDMMRAEKDYFKIHELATPESGGHSKADRIDRLEPDIRNGRFRFPMMTYNPDAGTPEGGFITYWYPWTKDRAAQMEEAGHKVPYTIGQIVHRPARGTTARMKEMARVGQDNRVMKPLKHLDENGDIYDATRVLIDEIMRHPFAPHDDFIDATSRIYDMNPIAPIEYEQRSTEPIEALGAEGVESD